MAFFARRPATRASIRVSDSTGVTLLPVASFVYVDKRTFDSYDGGLLRVR